MSTSQASFMALAVALCALAVVPATVTALTPYALPLAVADIVAATTTATNKSLVFSHASTFEFDPTTGQWTTILNASGTMTAAGAPMADEVVIVGGGGQVPTANCTIYHATAKSFTQCPRMPTARGFLAAAAVDSTVYAIGGFALKGWNVVESFDFTSATWTSNLPQLPTPRYGLSAAAVGGIVYTFGGVAWHVPASGAVEAFNPTTQHWTTMTSMITPRSFMAVAVQNDLIYTCGGNNGKINTVVVEVFNPKANKWVTGAPLPDPTRSHWAAFLAAPPLNAIIVAGGTTGRGLSQHDVDYVNVVKPIA